MENRRLIARNIAFTCTLAVTVFSCANDKPKAVSENNKELVINTSEDTLKSERVRKIFYTDTLGYNYDVRKGGSGVSSRLTARCC